jgi:hypothetical protein
LLAISTVRSQGENYPRGRLLNTYDGPTLLRNDVPTGHFSGEESSYVAVTQSLSVLHFQCKSSAKIAQWFAITTKSIQIMAYLQHVQARFSGPISTETFGEPEGEGENNYANLIVGLP